jgi:radical SAM superfamily enzyme YgiQ (UPF0313 family)
MEKIKLAMCYPSLVKENIGTDLLFSPLALAYLGRHTPDHYKISLYDEYVGENIDPVTVDADIVAVSSLSSGISRAYEIADKLRQRGIVSVLGGAHASSLPDEALEHFDTVIIGEGENPWKEFISDFENNRIKRKYYGPMDVSLDQIKTPRRDLIHPNYHYASVMTSRGCPYSCDFCYLTIYQPRKFRTISHHTVLEDLDSLRKKEILIFTDENFIGYSERDIEDRKQLMLKIIQKKYGFIWGCQLSATIANYPDLMKLMYDAGCRVVFIGFESSDRDSLMSVNKIQNVGLDYTTVVKRLHENKIAVIASCILGLDNQTNLYHKQLIREIKNTKMDFVRVFYLTAWPGTKLYKDLEKENRITQNWDILRKDIPSIRFKNYTHEEAIAARKEILDSFFNWSNLLLVILRWLLKERSLMKAFIKMSIRNRFSERIKNTRALSEIRKTSA